MHVEATASAVCDGRGEGLVCRAESFGGRVDVGFAVGGFFTVEGELIVRIMIPIWFVPLGRKNDCNSEILEGREREISDSLW